jgi:hypothetical protein
MMQVMSRNEYLNEKAGRKLNGHEQRYIKKKVVQWQEYEKGKLGFNKKELSKINSVTVVDKCIEFDFEDNKY